jgi:tetratricopeptide (TPR) repeat protein
MADYDKCIQHNDKNLDAYFHRGLAKLEKKEYDSAIFYYDECIELDAKHSGAYCQRGVAKFEKEDDDSAIADYDECIKLDAKHSLAYYSLGSAELEKEDYDGAIADFDEAIKLNDKHSDAYFNRGAAKLEKEDCDGAIADFGECMIRLNKLAKEIENEGNRNPKVQFCITDAYQFRGHANFQKDGFEDAIEDYTYAIRLKKSAVFFQDRANAAHAPTRADENRASRLNNGPIVHQVGLGAPQKSFEQ